MIFFLTFLAEAASADKQAADLDIILADLIEVPRKGKTLSTVQVGSWTPTTALRESYSSISTMAALEI